MKQFKVNCVCWASARGTRFHSIGKQFFLKQFGVDVICVHRSDYHRKIEGKILEVTTDGIQIKNHLYYFADIMSLKCATATRPMCGKALF